MFQHSMDCIADDFSWHGDFSEAVETLKDSSSSVILVSNMNWDIDFDDVSSVITSKSAAEAAELLSISQKKYSSLSDDDLDRLIEKRFDDGFDQEKLREFFRLPKEVLVSVTDPELLDKVKEQEYCDELCDFVSDSYGTLLNGFSADVLTDGKVKPNFRFDELRTALDLFQDQVIKGYKQSSVCGPWEIEGAKFLKNDSIGLYTVCFKGEAVIVATQGKKDTFSLVSANLGDFQLPPKAFKAACYLIHDRFSTYSMAMPLKNTVLSKLKKKTMVSVR